MTTEPAYSRLSFAPIADPSAIIVSGEARFTVLTSRIVRMEYSRTAAFEDRPSQIFWYRHQPVVKYEVERTNGKLLLTTEHLRLEYREGQPFNEESLSVTLLSEGGVWHFGDVDEGNLKGTARTLDEADGEIILEQGLISRGGWTIVDDSHSLIFDDSGWLVNREAQPGTYDLYIFGYDLSFGDAIRDYCEIAGAVPMVPRWALGNWWSRYWAYTDAELRQLMSDFRDYDIPLAVCIIDMDWHLVDLGKDIDGWTGYTWNTNLFPDPTEFIQWLHDQGLRTALNLHPALGVRSHEAMYAEMAKHLGVDPISGATIPFDIADPDFVRAYFEILHHPQEANGIDFWWIDWQQGKRTAVAGLDPLWWLNHLHYYDLGRQGKRPFIFSRWGGLGNHRYPIGFSGDTIVSWESLAFQPYFTATAANVAYGWWSHDIGGHMKGVEDRELYTRWVQFGVFSPVFRLHSTKNIVHERRPWGYDPEVLRITRKAMQLRHRLIPYLYTMSWLNEAEARSLVRPMYHDYPEREKAYGCSQQYLFGTDFIVAPYTAPLDEETGLATQSVWLPPGEWFHFLTGKIYDGDATYVLQGDLEDIPVFVRAGAIIPLGPTVGWGGVENPDELHLHIYAGADGCFELFEDDGVSTSYKEGKYALTLFEQRWKSEQIEIAIAPAGGVDSIEPSRRAYYLYVHGFNVSNEANIRINGKLHQLSPDPAYVGDGARFRPFELARTANAEITLRIAHGE